MIEQEEFLRTIASAWAEDLARKWIEMTKQFENLHEIYETNSKNENVIEEFKDEEKTWVKGLSYKVRNSWLDKLMKQIIPTKLW